MSTQEVNPFTGQVLQSKLRSSILEIIDEPDPSATTVSATFEDLEVGPTLTYEGFQTLFLLQMSAFVDSGTNTLVEFAIRVDGGADIPIGAFFLTQQGDHHSITLSGLVAPFLKGDRQITLRWRRALGSGIVTVNNNDSIALSALQL